MVSENQKNDSSPHIGPKALWSPKRFSTRQYFLTLAGLLVLAGGILIFASSSTPPNPANPNNVQIGLMDSNGWGTANASYFKSKGVIWDRIQSSNSGLIGAALNGGSGYPGGYSVMVETPPNPTSAMNVMNQYKGYGSRVVFEFGNEQYLTNSGDSMSAGAYAQAYQSAYNQKQAAGITQPLLFMTTGDECWSIAVDPCAGGKELYLEKALSTVPNLQVDAFSTHTYGGANQDNSNHANGVNALIYQHQDAVNHGFTNTPWYVTEWGITINPASTASPGTTTCYYAKSYSDQASCLTSAYQQMMNLPWLKMIMYYQSHDDSTGYFGLITSPNAVSKDYVGEPAGSSGGGATPINPRPSMNALLSFLPTGGSSTGDTTPPAISLTAPAANASVNSIVTIAANASDNVGVANVQFKLDGSALGTPVGVAPYDYSWDTTKVANGTHTLTVVASDAAGNTSSASETVGVNNTISDTTPPSVPTGLAAKAVTSAEVDLSWNASTDNVGVTGYQVFRNGARLATVTTTSYKDVAVSANTTYTYTVVGFDAAGNASAQSASVSVTTPVSADKTPPSVPTGLKSTASTSTTISLSWNASIDTGGSGLAGYHVYRNNVLVGSPSGTTYTDSGLASGTAYSYAVSAYDNAANGSVASPGISTLTTTATASKYVQNFTWDASSHTLHWSAYPGASGYKIAVISKPSTTRDTSYIQNPPVIGTSWTAPVMYGQTVHYGIMPQVKNSNGSYSNFPGAVWAPEVSVSWPAKTFLQTLLSL